MLRIIGRRLVGTGLRFWRVVLTSITLSGMKHLLLSLACLWIAACAGKSPPPPNPDKGTVGPLPDHGTVAKDAGGSVVDSVVDDHLSCTGAEDPSNGFVKVSFTLNTVMVRNGTVDVNVTAPEPYIWVMLGIGAGNNPGTWVGGAQSNGCDDTGCHWAFSSVPVPDYDGPYSLGFMKDAVNDDANAGTTIGYCVP